MSSLVTIDIGSTATVRGYRLSCIHGESAAATLLDRPTMPDQVVVDVLFARHRTAHGCSCDWPVATPSSAFAEGAPDPQQASA